eukprot:CAMPEP_0173465236 /NCGR_PEP_ID=MMETSP1357-20121228/71281_1 /TAXON_ID=77926 /ORGANISM="Hemiselmis rufescens, Strain PCC563" /LENGTH=64 /DNA_ID=CAMNT_0014433203 /DNA_START=122 /DNA_END=313 /DNA_ORIENTATION=+
MSPPYNLQCNEGQRAFAYGTLGSASTSIGGVLVPQQPRVDARVVEEMPAVRQLHHPPVISSLGA